MREVAKMNVIAVAKRFICQVEAQLRKLQLLTEGLERIDVMMKPRRYTQVLFDLIHH